MFDDAVKLMFGFLFSLRLTSQTYISVFKGKIDLIQL